jgi:hypothetical protein
MVNTKHIPKSVVPAGDFMLPHPQYPSFYAEKKSAGNLVFRFPLPSLPWILLPNITI